jgi:hypothetical protein
LAGTVRHDPRRSARHKDPALLRTAFTNSLYRCFVRDEGRLVGAGRVLGDGVDAAYLCDVAILPSHQGLRARQGVWDGWWAGARAQEDHPVCGAGKFYSRFGFRA